MPNAHDESGPSRQYARLRALTIVASLVFIVMMSSTLALLQIRSETALRESILSQARAHAREFNAVRTYVQGHEGIYVPASQDTTINPSLVGIPSVVPTIAAPSGKIYVLQNSPLVARRISELLEEETGSDSVRMGLYGHAPLNPENTADAFALAAIDELKAGKSEVYSFGRSGGKDEFRYALGIPLTEKCGRCHEDLVGQKDGVAGAAVVRIDVTRSLRYIAVSRIWTAGAIAILLVVSMLALHVAINRVLKGMYLAQRQVYEMAHTDSLTGLSPRWRGLAALNDEVDRARREQRCVACCVMDLDDFKTVNDELGHAIGDRVLEAVGRAIRDNMRSYDSAARIGGEEFLLILPDSCTREVSEILSRLHAAIAGATLGLDGFERKMTCCVGVAVMDPSRSETAEDLFIRADLALLEAKRQGKNRDLVAEPAPTR